MNIVNQARIAKVLGRTQSFVSKRLSNNSLRGYEINKLSKALNIPREAFLDESAQEKYLGKVYIKNDTKTEI